MKNKIMITSLFAIGALTIGVATYAYQGNPGVQNPDCTDTERHTAVESMFEKGDYDSFKELFADKGVARRITSEEQFLKFVELRQANLNGDTDKVAELKAELNLGQKIMDGNGMKRGMMGNGEGRGESRRQGQHRMNR